MKGWEYSLYLEWGREEGVWILDKTENQTVIKAVIRTIPTRSHRVPLTIYQPLVRSLQMLEGKTAKHSIWKALHITNVSGSYNTTPNLGPHPPKPCTQMYIESSIQSV